MKTTYENSCDIVSRADKLVKEIIYAEIVGVTNCYKTAVDSRDDINGTDWIVEVGNKKLRIDTKIRKVDYGRDDVVLETYSNMTTKSVGWTRDTTKNTDLVLWIWLDTGNFLFLPFAVLMRAFCDAWESWICIFKPIYQTTIDKRPGKPTTYQSQSIIVPRECVVDIIRGLMFH